MTRFVIGPDVAVRLVRDGTVPAEGHHLLAPTLLRSQVLAELYAEVHDGRASRADADRVLDGIRALRIRLLGDRVLQRVAWTIAAELDRPDTFDAEYLALTRLQADAFVSLEPGVADTVRGVVPVAPYQALFEP